jgi:quercetin dioxygenase-like cupin family protein
MRNPHFFNVYDQSVGIPRKLADGLKTRIFVGENVMISVVEIEPGCLGAVHSHPEEQWGMVLKGSGTRIQDGVDHQVGDGDFWHTPGGMAHGFRAGPDGCTILDIFSPPRAAYKKAGEGFGD